MPRPSAKKLGRVLGNAERGDGGVVQVELVARALPDGDRTRRAELVEVGARERPMPEAVIAPGVIAAL
jgi:hypothetical protein